jgi:hypothetical protein
MNKQHVLVGKVLNGIDIAKDKEAIRFVVEDGDIVARCDADCCSHTWVEHVELPARGFPCTVLFVGDLDLPGSEDNHPEHDCLQVYGLKVSTDNGDIIIDFRNSSNGYYGGSLSFPGDYFYGGVFRQNVSEEEWEPVSSDRG